MTASPSESSGSTGTGLGAGANGGPIAGVSGGDGRGIAGQSGPGPTEYRVTGHATQTILCAGQCTELSAEAENGHAPYTYVWDNDLGSGPDPHTVCPTVTTTYSVTASDSAVSGEEFGRASRSTSGSIEIQVADSNTCSLDGGTPGEQPEGRELCSIAIPYEDENGYPVLTTWGDGQSLTTDAEGNLYLAGTYAAAIDLGDGFNGVETTPSAFIAKYSADCQLLWHRHFTVTPHSIRFNSVALSPTGELVVAGWLLGQVVFDQITVGDPGIEGFVGALIVSFDPSDGRALWASRGGSDIDGTGLYNLAFDSTGDIVVDGWAGAYLTIGGHELNNESSGALIAKLSSTGEYRFAQVFQGSEPYLHSAVGPDDIIAVSGLSRENTVRYGTEVVLDVPGGWHRYLALLDSSGVLLGSRDLDADLTELNTSIGIGAVRFDSHGDILVGQGDYVLESNGVAIPGRISKLDTQRELLWTIDVSPPGYQMIPFSQGSFALDSFDDIIHTDLIDNTTDSGEDAGIRAENKEPNDVIVQKLDPSGALIWSHLLPTDVFENTWGLAIAADDSIWVGHGEDNDADPYRGTLRITKLAP